MGFEKEQTWQYLFSSLAVQLLVLAQSQDAFPGDTWWKLLKCRGHVKLVGNDGMETMVMELGLVEVVLRMVMCFIVKMIFAKVLVLTIPFVLVGEATGLDFVKDAFAVTFVSGIDLKEERSFEAVLAGDAVRDVVVSGSVPDTEQRERQS